MALADNTMSNALKEVSKVLIGHSSLITAVSKIFLSASFRFITTDFTRQLYVRVGSDKFSNITAPYTR